MNSEALVMLRNNQAYLWKSMGKLNKALLYLQKAENMLRRNPDLLSGVTFLNLCAILSTMNK